VIYRVGPASLAPTLARLKLTKNLPSLIQLVCLIVELLVSYWGHCRTNSQKERCPGGTGRIQPLSLKKKIKDSREIARPSTSSSKNSSLELLLKQNRSLID